MPHLIADDGTRLLYEERGAGNPLVFVHEYGGDVRSWLPQVEAFAGSYRCICYNARGYPPSDVPDDPERYSQERARDDLRSVLDALGIAAAHVVGLSMGAFAALHLALAYPERARSITVAGIGYGAPPAVREAFQAESRANAELIARAGMAAFVEAYGHGPTRSQLGRKDPAAYEAHLAQFREHSALGSANTMLGVQARRPSLFDLGDRLARLPMPVLILAGDEDEPSIEGSLFLRRQIPEAGLAMLPRSGHLLNLEEPRLFNQLLADFLARVEDERDRGSTRGR